MAIMRSSLARYMLHNHHLRVTAYFLLEHASSSLSQPLCLSLALSLCPDTLFVHFVVIPHTLVLLQIYPTKDYTAFDDALDALASEDAFRIDTPGAAAFACAGPVLDNKCVMTNLEWIIDGHALTVKYGIRYNLHRQALQVLCSAST